MSVYFVSRHEGAVRWARFHNKRGELPHAIDHYVEHLNVEEVRRGDVVIGTLPLKEIAALQKKGAQFYSIDIQTPRQLRGKELSSTEMAYLRTTLTRYKVLKIEDVEFAPKRGRAPTSKPPVWVSLVSDELAPHLIALSHFPAAEVILVVTPQMNDAAKRLKKMLDGVGMNPPTVKHHALDFETYDELCQAANTLLSGLADMGHEKIYLNLTGGDKLMAMAFDAAARQPDVASRVLGIYVDTKRKKIFDTRSRTEISTASCLNVKQLLECSGLRVLGSANASRTFEVWQARSKLTNFLASSKAGRLIGPLNSLMSEIDSKLQQKTSKLPPQLKSNCRLFNGLIEVSQSANPALLQALRGEFGKLLLGHQIISAPVDLMAGGGVCFRMTSPAEIDYLKGGWLEVFVASLFEKANVDDWQLGVQIKAQQMNELDVVACCGNKLLFVEVKTSNQSRAKGKGGEKNLVASDALYKVDSVGKKVARYFNEKIYASYRELDGEDLDRAKDLGISVFMGHERREGAGILADLGDAINHWAKSARLELAKDFAHSALPVDKKWIRFDAGQTSWPSEPGSVNAGPRPVASKPPEFASTPPKSATEHSLQGLVTEFKRKR